MGGDLETFVGDKSVAILGWWPREPSWVHLRLLGTDNCPLLQPIPYLARLVLGAGGPKAKHFCGIPGIPHCFQGGGEKFPVKWTQRQAV